MLNKLLNFASSLLNQESSDALSNQEQTSPTESNQQPAPLPMNRPHSDRNNQAPETFNIIEFSSESSSHPQCNRKKNIAQPHTPAHLIPDSLDDLYQTLSLEAGMVYIADALAQLNADTYIPSTDQWLKQSNFQTLGMAAIASKRQGHYGDAMMIFNELAQQCPYYYQIHSSTMKVLAASGRVDAALRAAQLWCIAIIPEKV